MTNHKQTYFGRVAVRILAIVISLVLSGCGYHLKGAGLKAPEGIEAIAVMVLENYTSESGIESVFTGDLIYEFTRSKVVRVVSEAKADAILTGRIKSLDVETISHTTTYNSSVRRVAVTVDFSLKRVDGKTIWSAQGLSDNEPFDVSDNKLTTESNRRAAIEVISERLAEKVHDRILQDF